MCKPRISYQNLPLESKCVSSSILKTLMPKSMPLYVNYSSSISALFVDLALNEMIPTSAYNLTSHRFYGKNSINQDEKKTSFPVLLVVCILILFVSMEFLMYLFYPEQVMVNRNYMIFMTLLLQTVKVKLIITNQSLKCIGKLLDDNQAHKTPSHNNNKWRIYHHLLFPN